jgi:ATP/maltotriose-dependent transcriptional regulator MalT
LDDLIRSAALSPREAEILTLLYTGESISDIATHLGVAQGTLYWHTHNIRKKFSRRQ